VAETLFGATVPTSTNLSDGSPGLTLGTRIRVAVNGTFTGVRWRFPDTLPASPVQWFLVSYDPVTDTPTGSLASGTFVGPTPGVYNTASFAPVAVAAGAEVVAEIWTADRYVATGTFFTVDYVNGNLTGPADDAVGVPTHRNGRFRSGVPAFPSLGNNSSYFVDVVFEADAVAVTGVLAATLPHLTAELDGETSSEGVLDAVLPVLQGDIVGLVTQHGVLDATLPALQGAFRGSSAAGGATVGPCGWSIPDPLCCSTEWALVDPAVQSAARDYAALILWGVTGRQFGLCEVTVRPCGMKRCADGSGEFWGYDWSGGTWVPYIFNGQWFNCGCGAGCCCDPRCQVRLMGPVEEMVEVLIGGIAVDPATYHVDDDHWLVRSGGECWPQCADMDNLVGDNTFEVTYLRGTPVPTALLRAAATLACEWAKACVGSDTCRLSNRVTSVIRQGITIDMVDPTVLLDQGLTGLWEVDTILKVLNPHRTVERLRIYAPELNVPRMTTWQ
jgi:hypothetical protein